VGLTKQRHLLPFPLWSGGNIFSVALVDSALETRMALLCRSARPLETKDIQEFILAISDFLKSAKLASNGGRSK